MSLCRHYDVLSLLFMFVQKPQKTEEAPWERPSFITQVDLSKSEADISSMQISGLAGHILPEVDVHIWEVTMRANQL